VALALSTIDPNDPSPLTVIGYWVHDKTDGKSYVVRISGTADGPACEPSGRELVGVWWLGAGQDGLPAACRVEGATVLWVNAFEDPTETRDDVLRLAQDLRRVDAAWLTEHAVS